ncbi:MAG: carboxypeptidase regulatory-like domain-containing protein [Planctomycetes bacterium]|nr:carboxypeptidase regulatory-like domain-containing protein [Planctomycetota bacterium]
MRVVVFLLGAAGAVAFALWWWSSSGPEVRVVESQDSTPVPKEERPATPLRTDRASVPAPAQPVPAPGTVAQSVTLRVLDEATGAPLDGGTLRVLSGDHTSAPAPRGVGARPTAKTVFAGSLGEHQLSLLPGTYTAVAQRADIVRATRPLAFTVGEGALTVEVRVRLAEAMLTLDVLDRADNSRVANYHATIRTRPSSGAPRTEYLPAADAKDAKLDNPLVVHCARGDRLTVRIEADGFVPAEPLDCAFGDAAHQEHKVFLLREARFTGVELRVTDQAQQPIRQLQVKAKLQINASEPFRDVWTRRATSDTGRYRLPGLASGNYQLEVVAIDDAGAATLHLPHRMSFQFTGSEQIVQPITLLPGANLQLEVVDDAGRMLSEGVRIELTHPDGRRREAVWQAFADDKPMPNTALAIDHLLADAPARLHRAVPAGRYSVTVRRGTDDPVQQTATLEAGRNTILRVTLKQP